MGIYVEIDDILDLFGCSDWEIEAKETIQPRHSDQRKADSAGRPDKVEFSSKMNYSIFFVFIEQNVEHSLCSANRSTN